MVALPMRFKECESHADMDPICKKIFALASKLYKSSDF